MNRVLFMYSNFSAIPKKSSQIDVFAKQKRIRTIEAGGSACRWLGQARQQGLFAFIHRASEQITKTESDQTTERVSRRERKMLCSLRNHENEQQPRLQIEVNKSKLSLKRIG